jgi:hypothetical protein
MRMQAHPHRIGREFQPERWNGHLVGDAHKVRSAPAPHRGASQRHVEKAPELPLRAGVVRRIGAAAGSAYVGGLKSSQTRRRHRADTRAIIFAKFRRFFCAWRKVGLVPGARRPAEAQERAPTATMAEAASAAALWTGSRSPPRSLLRGPPAAIERSCADRVGCSRA